MNSVNLIGNLTRDPEVRYTSSGSPIVTFGIAWNGRKKAQNGDWVDEPHFFNVTAFGEKWEKLAAHLEKGKKVGISGRLDFSSWVTQEGQKRTSVGIVAFDLTFCSLKGEGGGNGGGRAPADADIPDSAFGGASDFVPVGTTNHEDDDIPF